MLSSRDDAKPLKLSRQARKILQDAVMLYADPGRRNNAITKVLELATTDNNLTVKRIGEHSNNLIFRVEGMSDAPLIIQLTKKSPAAVRACLILEDINPTWTPDTYFAETAPAKAADTKPAFQILIVECLQHDLFNLIESLSPDESSFEKRFSIAIGVGNQLSDVLQFLTAHRLIWTDMKPGNILLRKNGSIAIADHKTLQDPGCLDRKDDAVVKLIHDKFKYVKKGYQNLHFDEVTEPYLSEYFRLEQQCCANTTEEARLFWEQEYSYQLAVHLHYILIPEKSPRLSADFPINIAENNLQTSFNFDYPVFQTDKGRCMREIIELLGAHNPSQRMHHSELSGLLGLVNKPELFAAKVKEIRQKIENDPTRFIDQLKELGARADKLREMQETFKEFTEQPKKRGSRLGLKKKRDSKSPRQSHQPQPDRASRRLSDPGNEALFKPSRQSLKPLHKSEPEPSGTLKPKRNTKE